MVEQTPPSLRKAPPTGAALIETPKVVVDPHDVPPVLANIPGINTELLTEADLLLADPATHSHPLGSHGLLPLHPGYDKPHSHPPFNQHPVIDMTTGEVISHPAPELLDLHSAHHPVHEVHPPALQVVKEEINSIHHPHIPYHPKPAPYHAPIPHPHPIPHVDEYRVTPAPHHAPVHHHPTPVAHHAPVHHHPTPVPHHAPVHHASPVPHHVTPVPHHAHAAHHAHPAHAAHPGPHYAAVPHLNHPPPTHSYAPVPLGYRTEVPVKYHELGAPAGHHAVPHHAVPHHGTTVPHHVPGPYQGKYHDSPYRAPLYNPKFAHHRRHYKLA